MEYFVIGDEDTVLGFSLVGVRGEVVESREEALGVFNRITQDKSFGIFIITEAIAALIREEVDQFLFSSDFPLIVEIPDARGQSAEGRDLRAMVQAAIGIAI